MGSTVESCRCCRATDAGMYISKNRQRRIDERVIAQGAPYFNVSTAAVLLQVI